MQDWRLSYSEILAQAHRTTRHLTLLAALVGVGLAWGAAVAVKSSVTWAAAVKSCMPLPV